MPLDYTILTQDGTDNTGTDGARDRYFAAGGRDGIIKGSLNEGKLIITPNNGIMMDTCVLLICGNPIIIDEAWSKTFSSIPSTNERHALVAQITVDNNRHKTFDILDLPATTTLIKDKLFKNLNGAGTYQVEIGRFTLTTSGLVENLTRTIDVITGGGTADSELHWGTITAYALGHNEDPEADFEQRYDEEQGYMVTDVLLGIPSGSIDNLDDTLSPTSHNAIENQAVTNALANRYTKTETDNLLNNKADLFNLQQDFAAKTVTIGNTGTNKVIISTPDSTTTYIWAPDNNILIQAGQSSVPNKNIILTPTGNVICKSDLQFEDGHTASVPTPTANNHAVPKSYVDDNLDDKVNKNSLYAHYINGYGSSGSVCFTTFDNNPTITINNASELYSYLTPWQNVYLPCSGSVYINSQFSANPVCAIRRANGSIYFMGKATDGTYNTSNMPYDISSLGSIFNTIQVYNQKLI